MQMHHKFTTDDIQYSNGLQPLACIITERFDDTLKDQANYYFREESKKECQEETTQNKVD